MRYWIVSELFFPDEVSTGYVITKIAERLNESVSVGVICGPEGYQSSTFKSKKLLPDGILIKRFLFPRFSKNNLFFRVLWFIFLTLGISFLVLINVKRRDKLILVTNPATLLPITFLLKKLKGFGLLVIVHDLFPENAVATGLISEFSVVYKIINLLFEKSYCAADHLIVVGNDMKQILEKKVGSDKSISVITNWADHEEVFPNHSTEFWSNYNLNSSKIVIQFAGNIGRLQGLDRLVDHLSKVTSDQWHLVLIGDGAEKNRIESLVCNKGINNIQFISSRPRDEQNEFLNACDIGLVTLIPGMRGLGVPSKVYNLLSAGKPVLFIGDSSSEISMYIEEYNVGWAFDWQDSAGIIKFFETIESKVNELPLKGSNARELVLSKFTKDIILEKYRTELINF